MNARRTLWSGAITALAMVGALTFAGADAATAAEDDITWSVSPADQSGADHRRWIEQELDPGKSASDFFAVKNLSASEVEFTLSAADGYFTQTGRFNMLPSDQPSTDAGTWITLQPTVVVPAGETRVVPFTLTVPEDALPGDHPAGIAASVISDGSDGNGTSVGVESRVGFRVMTRVTGAIVPAVDATVLSTDYAGSWNPFSPGTLTVTYKVANSGNTRVGAASEIDVTGPFGIAGSQGDGEPIVDSFPGDERTMTVQVRAWPLVLLTSQLLITPSVLDTGVQPDAGGDPVAAPDALEIQSTTWAMPWPQLITVVILAMLVWLVLLDRRRRKKNFADALEFARDEGRSEAIEAMR